MLHISRAVGCVTVTHDVTIDGDTLSGLGDSAYSAFSILATQEGQWRFERRNEVSMVSEGGVEGSISPSVNEAYDK